jgi:hypothetical protein
MLFTDPCAGTSRLAGPRWWAKGMPPLWQYLCPPSIGGGAHRCPQRARTRDPCQLFRCKTAYF